MDFGINRLQLPDIYIRESTARGCLCGLLYQIGIILVGKILLNELPGDVTIGPGEWAIEDSDITCFKLPTFRCALFAKNLYTGSNRRIKEAVRRLSLSFHIVVDPYDRAAVGIYQISNF